MALQLVLEFGKKVIKNRLMYASTRHKELESIPKSIYTRSAHGISDDAPTPHP